MALLKERFLFVFQAERKKTWKTRMGWFGWVWFGWVWFWGFLLLVHFGGVVWFCFVFRTLLVFNGYCCNHIFLWLIQIVAAKVCPCKMYPELDFFRGLTEFHENVKGICVTPVLFQTVSCLGAKQDLELTSSRIHLNLFNLFFLCMHAMFCSNNGNNLHFRLKFRISEDAWE